MRYAYLDKEKNVVPVTFDVWLKNHAKYLENDQARRVDYDVIGKFTISTVFLAMDHSWQPGKHLWFETMVFGGDDDQYQSRCETWAEAVKMHKDAVTMVKSKIIEPTEEEGEDTKNWHGNHSAEFEDLKGKTLKAIVGGVGDETMIFITDKGDRYQLQYYHDCCASCNVEDICGDLDDLLESPILLAEEESNRDKNPEGVPVPEYQDSFTWTFYKLSTIKGSVTIRWYGSSNGYYSESATFEKVGK